MKQPAEEGIDRKHTSGRSSVSKECRSNSPGLYSFGDTPSSSPFRRRGFPAGGVKGSPNTSLPPPLNVLCGPLYILEP